MDVFCGFCEQFTDDMKRCSHCGSRIGWASMDFTIDLKGWCDDDYGYDSGPYVVESVAR